MTEKQKTPRKVVDEDDSNAMPSPSSRDEYPIPGEPHPTPSEELAALKQMRQKAIILDRDSWLNTRLLKILGIVYGIAAPFFIWIVVTNYNQDSKIAVMEVQQRNFDDKLVSINKVYEKLDEMSATINKIQIDIATLKAKAGIP